MSMLFTLQHILSFCFSDKSRPVDNGMFNMACTSAIQTKSEIFFSGGYTNMSFLAVYFQPPAHPFWLSR